MNRHILVIYAGGTIGMTPTPSGFAPAPGTVAPKLAEVVSHGGGALPDADLIELDPLIDSANATPATWQRIAAAIWEARGRYDGFVVLHGTDTMAYTSSALSFLLPGFCAPMVVTGAQIPLVVPGSDGYANLAGALRAAASGAGGVSLLFGSRLLRGNRATKVDATGLQAFDSPGVVPLAIPEADEAAPRTLPSSTAGVPRLRRCATAHVAALRLFPGIEGEVVSNVCRPPLQGLVMEAYGTGNGPAGDPGFLGAIRKATARGVVVVVVTQCLHGSVIPGAYATGTAMLEAGATPGFDMTTEAALTKLWVLLGEGLDPEEVRRLMTTDLAGELTAPV